MGVSANTHGLTFHIPNKYDIKEIGNKLEDFEIIQNLGQGGNAFVLKARSKKNFKLYAIKKSKEIKDEQKREIIILQKLDHPNICQCKAVFKEEGYYYIVMDLFNNKDLYRYLSANMEIGKKIKEENIWQIFNQCLFALAYIHSKGYIHRDIKLGNIFMNDNGKVVIGDFGLCAMFDQNEFNKLNVDEKNLLKFIPSPCGTQNFFAPEITSGNYIQNADVYSLGVCFFCLCYQNLPPQNYEQILTNDQNYDFELRKLIFNMLNPNPNQRPSSSDLYNYFKKIYIQNYVTNTCIYSVLQCLFNYPNFLQYFSDPFEIQYISGTEYKKDIFYCLLAIKNSMNDISEIESNAYVLRQKIVGEENKLKDNVELAPVDVVNSILNSLYNELNQIPNENQKLLVSSNVFNDFNKFVNHFDQRFYSIISQNFTGVLRKTLKCQEINCQGQELLFQKYNFIYFNISNYINNFSQNTSVKIEDIFNYYNNTFVSLKFNQLIDCQFCKRKTHHIENKQFYRLPKNLIIMLDKTKCNNINVDFNQNLYLKDQINAYNYTLYGFISEEKNMNNGKTKYIAFIKKNNGWIKCDNNYFSFNNNFQMYNFQNIKNYGNIISLFYYDENRVINQPTNININYNTKLSNSIINSTNEFANKYMFNNLYNNTIDFNMKNNNFNWQIMSNQPINNNINNNQQINNNLNINNNNNNFQNCNYNFNVVGSINAMMNNLLINNNNHNNQMNFSGNFNSNN